MEVDRPFLSRRIDRCVPAVDHRTSVPPVRRRCVPANMSAAGRDASLPSTASELLAIRRQAVDLGFDLFRTCGSIAFGGGCNRTVQIWMAGSARRRPDLLG